MNKKLATSIVIALFLLAGCAASGPKLASSAEDIAGTWQTNTYSGEVQINEDGTIRAENPQSDVSNEEFWFEGTRFFLTGIGCTKEGYETGIYEIELLENGNLKFTTIEDDCVSRNRFLLGTLTERQFEPVP